MKSRTKTNTVAAVQSLIAGTQKHLAPPAQVKVAGESLTSAQVVTKLQQVITLRSEAESAKATASAKIADEEAALPELLTFIGAFSSVVRGAFVGSPDVLADFGLAAKKRATPSTTTKVAASAKRQATRQARNTMGPKQKASIKGGVTGVTIVPQPAPSPVDAKSANPSAPAGATASPSQAPAPTPASHTS